MSQVTGAKKPSESQKATAFWATKATWDRSEEYYDPARKQDILTEQKSRGFVGRTSQRPDCDPVKSVGMLGKYHLVLALSS